MSLRRTFTCLLSASLAVSAAAQLSGPGDTAPTSPSTPSGSPSPSSLPSSSPRWESSNSSTSSSDYYPRNDLNTRSPFPSERRTESPVSRPRPIFFPPNPPPLGGPVSMLSTRPSRRNAPAELGDYINEPFYAPLSTLLAEGTLSRKLRDRLDRYREMKLALQNEFHGRFATLKDLEPGPRRQALESFAREQTPRIVELERMADELREDFISAGTDWNALRRWKLGTKNPDVPVTGTYLVTRAAAFYQKGLSPAQRRLLREVAMEMESVVLKNQVDTSSELFLYFSPETSRIRVASDLPPALLKKITDYEARKAVLRKELFDAVFEHDADFFGFLRSSALRSLSDRQEPQLAALEALAEEIRRELAEIPESTKPPALPTLPPELVDRIAAYVRDRRALNRQALAKVDEIRKIVPVEHIAIESNEGREGQQISIAPSRSVSASRIQLLKDTLGEFNRSFAESTAELLREKEGIRTEIARLFSSDPKGGRSIDRLLAEFTASLQQHEDWQNFSDYRIAVLEPGLSPEQRRLIFDAAVESFDLTLPGGDLQPFQ